MLGVVVPHVVIDRAHSEVHREQRREEHELAGQPHDGANGDHVWPVRRRMGRMVINHSCSRHGVILAGIPSIGASTPPVSGWAWRTCCGRRLVDREMLHKQPHCRRRPLRGR